jgi:hypothetical protein
LIANQSLNLPITALQLQDYYLAAQNGYNFSNLGALSISAGTIYYTNLDPNGNALPSAAYPTNPYSVVGWDASTASGSPYVAFPATGPGSVLGEVGAVSVSDTIDNDSTIVVVATAPFKIPFLPNFYGALSTSLSFRVLALARPRYELQVAKGF